MGNIFLSNLSKPTFLEIFREKVEQSTEILISVSFIKLAGLRLIQKDIISALELGVKVKIITSTYKNFTDPSVLYEFLSWSEKYSNFECRLEDDSFSGKGFHTKGYIFLAQERVSIIIGSTNITKSALMTNFEWNSLVETNKDLYFDTTLEEFYFIWQKVKPLSTIIVKNYEIRKINSFESWDMDYELSRSRIQPNKMQEIALIELNKNRREKALIVAAMGTGKTYLAAMDAKAYGAQKVLFVVHRENILDNAIKAFKEIFGEHILINKFLGSEKDARADFIFTTNLTIDKAYQEFDPYYFDYIIIDEVHHAAASTYQNIIRYFKPDFLLGLTATPERMDDRNIYEIFDYIVPFEIRLREAIENGIIVPFQYFGIRNKNINYDEDYSKKQFDVYLKEFTSERNAKFIAEEVKKHPVKDKLKALCFCSSVEHANKMAEAMKDQGFHAEVLNSKNNAQERNSTFQRLANEKDSLSMIFTVDILNEGIDIPSVNMVLFLRPTESVTVFIQQLGRGLRKYPNKEYLIVLDFIGNSYKRSIYIAKALGTLSNVPMFNKKQLIHLIKNDFKEIVIPNLKISIDELSKEEILQYLESMNENSRNSLKKDYQDFKKYLGLDKSNNGVPPKHVDFLDRDRSPDLVRFIRSTSVGRTLGNSYYSYLESIGENVPRFNKEQIKLLNFLSKLLPLFRPEEFFVVKSLLAGPKTKKEMMDDLGNFLIQRFYPFFDHALGFMVGKLNPNKFKEEEAILITDQQGKFSLKADLSNPDFFDHLEDLLQYGLKRFEMENGLVSEQLSPYKTYFNHQFMLAMCETYLSYQKGTLIKDDKVYIFTNLNKDDQTKEDLKYHDAFIDPNTFLWESKINVTMESKEGQLLIKSKEAHLFVRAKSNAANMTLPMIYLGKGKLLDPQPHATKKTLQFRLELQHSVPTEIFEELKNAHE
jgi:superfamily II DNA or RNA helicase/HKD family nuclease